MLNLTRDQVREVDRLAIEELGIPGIVLMENASRGVADHVLALLEDELHLIAADGRVAILCGGGNNGGDGYAIARHLANAGAQVTAFAVSDPAGLGGDAATNCAIAQRMGLVQTLQGVLEIANNTQWHVVIDALLGTGFHGRVRDDLVPVIDACVLAGEQGAKVVAVDVPSGLDCDTGEPSNATVVADLTVTFLAVKRGLATPAAEPYVGRFEVVDIGVPPALIARVLRAG